MSWYPDMIMLRCVASTRKWSISCCYCFGLEVQAGMTAIKNGQESFSGRRVVGGGDKPSPVSLLKLNEQ